MHHSDQALEAAQAEFAKRLREEAEKFGFVATGQFPEGKLVDHDEGEIQFGVTNHQGKVILNFNTSVRWLGMDPDQARLLARSLMQHATKAEKEKKPRHR